ncbi:Type II CAAX prenyl endopeptidase Rce1-like [Dillenia turbinata]|uniref:Type II CAAX prenyl endopeptidase Rce1-like n=1 Tax=Dillenia turbinata TaxID=194707 RepID=A0AAN8UQ14_9MAGN
MGCLEQQGFSVLVDSDGSWDSANIWSTLALYMFSFHIPLSFGGLSIVASILHRPVLDPQAQAWPRDILILVSFSLLRPEGHSQALSILIIQILELTAAVILLKHTTTNQYSILSLFQPNELARDRNWLVAAVIGFGFLMLVVFLTSIVADQLIGPKVHLDFPEDVGNPMVKEILSDGPISKAACILVYCILTPLLEEIIYRGFLLKSLVTKMKWQQAVVVSSVVFSAAHLSGENSLQLFIIGCVLGSSYCWSGNLRTSFTIHSLYNAVILMSMVLS